MHSQSNCPTCQGYGYIVKDLNMYEYMGEPKVFEECKHIKDHDARVKAMDKLREEWKSMPLQITAIPCPECNGTEQRVEQKKRKARLPEIMQEATMDDFDWTLYKDSEGRMIDTDRKQQFVTSFLTQFKLWEDKGVGLYVSSRIRGSGKTFLASAICNELMTDKLVDVRFVSASELIAIDAGEYKEQNITTKTLIDAQLLVIDDLGQKNTGQGWIEDVLYRIIDARMNKKKLMIVTSNYKLGELEFDNRIVDRLNKMLQPIDLPEISVRTIKASGDKAELFKAVGLMG